MIKTRSTLTSNTDIWYKERLKSLRIIDCNKRWFVLSFHHIVEICIGDKIIGSYKNRKIMNESTAMEIINITYDEVTVNMLDGTDDITYDFQKFSDKLWFSDYDLITVERDDEVFSTPA